MEKSYPSRNIHRFNRAAPNSVFAIPLTNSNVFAHKTQSERLGIAGKLGRKTLWEPTAEMPVGGNGKK